MITKYSTVIKGSSDKPILIDSTFSKECITNKVVIFSHGFKGFKDWGPFNKIADCFASNGFVFVKFNFSYNGTSIESAEDFVDYHKIVSSYSGREPFYPLADEYYSHPSEFQSKSTPYTVSVTIVPLPIVSVVGKESEDAQKLIW